MEKNLQTLRPAREWACLRRRAALTFFELKACLTGWLAAHWFRLLLLSLLVWILLRKDLTVQVSLQSSPLPTSPSGGRDPELPVAEEATPYQPKTAATPVHGKREPDTELSATPAERRYVGRFAGVAQEERRRFDIPAAIILAQGLLESQAGTSPLAVKNNNHFGVKCFSRNCRAGHCRNFTDDSHKDFFRVYATAWESFRAHSLLLQSDRYRHLSGLDPTDYRSWARGLQKAGYATDERYAEKLIGLIERLALHRFDEPRKPTRLRSSDFGRHSRIRPTKSAAKASGDGGKASAGEENR